MMNDTGMRFAAHRGVVNVDAGIRENTLASFRAAVEAGADLVELDVRLTADGSVVVLHDPDMLRVWGDPRRIDSVTLRELRDGCGDADHRIPTLGEALAVVQGSRSRLLVDMDDEVFAAPALDVVMRCGMGREVEWCGAIEAMCTIRGVDVEAVIWIPWSDAELPSLEDIETLRPQVLNAPHLAVGPDLVERAHELGLEVCCWTVDDAVQARHLAGIGVDGITSNRLAAIRESARSFDADHEESESERDERAFAVARLIAQDAAELIRESADDYRTHVHGKATPADLVTDLDGLIERLVRQALHAQFPEIPIVGEEMGGDEPERGDCWFLDPLDGSINYANGLPWFSFSLALVRDGSEPIVGAVIDPIGWRVITARLGCGAWAEGQRVTIPERTINASDPLQGTVVAVELDNQSAWRGLDGIFGRLSERYCTLRVPGSGTASVFGIALGRGVGALIGHFGPVDHFAGVLIVHEAGGVIMDMAGRETLNPRNSGFLAARDRRCAGALAQVWHEALSELE